MGNDRQWEEFKRPANHYWRKRPMVSWWGRRKLFLNAKACEALGRPENVILLFERASRTVGIRPGKEEPHRIKLAPTGKYGGRYFSAQGFFAHWGIEILAVKRWFPEVVDGMLIFNVDAMQ